VLSDRDARRLSELETSLRHEDPGFVEQFGAGWQEAHRRPVPPWVLWAYLPVVVLALVMPYPVPVVAALGLTCGVAYVCRPARAPLRGGSSAKHRGR
jgi:hypothetical protein